MSERYKGKRIEMKKGVFWAEYGYLMVTVVVVFVLFRVIFQLAWVPSGSMENTIPTKSLLFSLRLPYLVGDPALERGDAPLADSLKLFEEGTKLIASCSDQLDRAEQQVVKLMKGPDGAPVELPFESEEER